MEQNEMHIVRCPNCGTKNRLGRSPGGSAKCGKCGAPLTAGQDPAYSADSFLFRCSQCKTKNRIPAQKIHSSPNCGKCGAILHTDELFMPQPVDISDADFDAKVMKSPIPVLLFAWAPW